MLISISNVQCLSALHLLLSLWPNLVTWLSLRSVWRGETTKSVNAGKGFIAALFANNSPRLHVCVCVCVCVCEGIPMCSPVCTCTPIVYMHVHKSLCMSTRGCASLCARTCVHVDISTVHVHSCSREPQQKHMCEHTQQCPSLYTHALSCQHVDPCTCACVIAPLSRHRSLGVSTYPGCASVCICTHAAWKGARA